MRSRIVFPAKKSVPGIWGTCHLWILSYLSVFIYLRGPLPLPPNMTQKHTNTHFSKKGHVTKSQERFFCWEKNPAGAPKTGKSLYLAKGESWSYTRRMNSISREHGKVGFDEKVKLWWTSTCFGALLKKSWNDLTVHTVVLPMGDGDRKSVV